MKERLTGAIILVILIVLLVPELLTGPKGSSAPAPAAAGASSSEEPPLRSYTINLSDDSHARAAASSGNGPAMPQPSGPEPAAQVSGTPPPQTGVAQSSQAAGAQSSASPPSPPPPSVPPVQPAPSQSATSPAPTPSSQHGSSHHAATRSAAKPSSATQAVENSESGWVVQLGVFASRENAERLALDVRVKGFKAAVSPITTGGRKLYRVRVGPTPDREAAQELQRRLKAAGRPVGAVVPYS